MLCIDEIRFIAGALHGTEGVSVLLLFRSVWIAAWQRLRVLQAGNTGLGVLILMRVICEQLQQHL